MEILPPQETAVSILNDSLEAPNLDPMVLSVANYVIEGKSISEIAEAFSVPADVVSQVIEKKEVKSYIDNVYFSQGYLNRFKRSEIISNVINQKLQDALETGIYTKKDLHDWIKLLNDMERDAKPKNDKPAVAIQVNNNYEGLMKDLMSNGN